MKTSLFVILSASLVIAQPKPPALLLGALQQLPGVHVLEASMVRLPVTVADLKSGSNWPPWVVADLDRDRLPDVVAAVVKQTPGGTEYGVLAVHARTSTQPYWVVRLDTTPINGVAVGGFFGPDTVTPLFCYNCDGNPFYRWSGNAYELGLFSVGETIPLGSSTVRIVELFTESRLKSGIVGKVASCTEAKILATTGTSRDSRWYQVEVRGPKLLCGWVRATSIDTEACIG
jgi:hypothetical protein